jgi:hypothetical protein
VQGPDEPWHISLHTIEERKKRNAECSRVSSFTIILFTEYYEGEEIKQNDKAGSCSKHEKDKKCIQKSENHGGGKILGDLGINGKIIK